MKNTENKTVNTNSKNTSKYADEFEKSMTNVARETNLCDKACTNLDFVSANYHQALAINSAANAVRIANGENSDDRMKRRAREAWEKALDCKKNSDICQTTAQDPEAKAKAKKQAELSKLEKRLAELQAKQEELKKALQS